MTDYRIVWVTFALTIIVFIGCGGESAPNVDVSGFILAAEPDGASDVITARKSKDGQSVVVFGRIGGSESPWIDGRAAFTIVDSSLKPCNEIGDDACPKPWDYC